ncbi:uncharacterized protein LOC123307119 [Coccinella septempunctata]|uniref:uncharacterized protein LOC123307119 n=1 Tax=Coccinella septempunctata TaxID=41139 RepID=UPI001D0674F7|nr:uncharacterized protein LOC123307119 [Coccinella septempunctata]
MVDENILTVNIKLLQHNITLLAIYAPSDDESIAYKESFFETLNDVIGRIGDSREIIMMGDFNSRTGRSPDSDIIGPYGEEQVNDNGNRLIQLCETNNSKITNGFFQHRNIHRYTWVQPTRGLKSIIDYFIVKQKPSIQINDVRALRGAFGGGSDHFLVRAKVFFPSKYQVNNSDNRTIGLQKLSNHEYNLDSFMHESTVALYQQRLDNSLLTNFQDLTFHEIYDNIISSIKKAAKEALGIRKKHIPKLGVDYYKKLLTEDRQEYINEPTTERIGIQGETIEVTEDMVKKAMRGLKNGRACGPEGIYAELLKHGTEKLYSMITYLFNLCVNGHPIPDEWKSAYMISIYKKGNKKRCDNYRGLSITSTFSRLYGKVLRDLIEEETKGLEEEEQSGFHAGRTCSDNIFCLKQIIEKKTATNREVHITFVDLHKAYDTIPIVKLWEVLEGTNINHTLIKAVKDLYTGTKSRIKVGKYVTDEFLVNKGLRQGCCLSPTLFKLYVAAALKQWKKKVRGMGIELGNMTLYTLQFADDQAVVSGDKDDMEYMIRKLIEEYEKWGLNVNLGKTKYLWVGGEPRDLTLNSGEIITYCLDYNYLGVIFDSTGTDNKEIERRITTAKKARSCLNGILWNKNISKRRKFNIYETLVKSSLLYGSENWRLTDKYKRRLEAVEMDAIRRSLMISRRDRLTIASNDGQSVMSFTTLYKNFTASTFRLTSKEETPNLFKSKPYSEPLTG